MIALLDGLAALSWLQAILAARVDAAQVVSPYSGQELQRVLLARASGLSVVPCVFAVRLPSVAQAQPGQSRLPAAHVTKLCGNLYDGAQHWSAGRRAAGDETRQCRQTESTLAAR